VSCALDTNLLLYASDVSSPFHSQARTFLEARASSPDLLYVAWPVAMAYLRIATHPRIFAQPLSPTEALGNLTSLLAQPRVRAIGEQDGFLEIYRSLTDEVPVRGNLVPDAHLASILRQHGVRVLYTNDADFAKFPFIEPRNPFTGQ
jgi:toxin-antitoxin system PIN domain toxin